MPKIAILGCGWLGFPLAISLIKNRYSIIGTTTSIEKISFLKEAGINGKVWSLSDVQTKESTSFLNSVDILVLNIPPSKVKGEFDYSSSLYNLSLLLPPTTHVLFISSTSVYPENLIDANESYSWQKSDLLNQNVLAENKLLEVLGNRLTIVRMAGLIGSSRHPIKSMINKMEIPNGDAPINLIHLNDAIGIIEKIIDLNFWGEIINGCFPLHPSKTEYYSNSANFFNLPVPNFVKGGELNKIVSSEKSISKLKYSYSTSIFQFS
jgi:nucleoside-diphosphate-sugar epimerase